MGYSLVCLVFPSTSSKVFYDLGFFSFLLSLCSATYRTRGFNILVHLFSAAGGSAIDISKEQTDRLVSSKEGLSRSINWNAKSQER